MFPVRNAVTQPPRLFHIQVGLAYCVRDTLTRYALITQ